MHKLALVLLLVVPLVPPQTLRSQSALARQPVVRYHFGDNPAWAAPSFNDSSWPIANDGWPIPPLHSDGIVWVRMRIPVPPAPDGRLGLMVDRAHARYGSERQRFIRKRAPTATIAIRLWYPPISESQGEETPSACALGPRCCLGPSSVQAT